MSTKIKNMWMSMSNDHFGMILVDESEDEAGVYCATLFDPLGNRGMTKQCYADKLDAYEVEGFIEIKDTTQLKDMIDFSSGFLKDI